MVELKDYILKSLKSLRSADKIYTGLKDASMAKECIKKLTNSYGAEIRVTVTGKETSIVLTNSDIAWDIVDNPSEYNLSARDKYVVQGGEIKRLEEYLATISDDLNMENNKLLREYNSMLKMFATVATDLDMNNEEFEKYRYGILNGDIQDERFLSEPMSEALLERRIVDREVIAQLFTWREVKAMQDKIIWDGIVEANKV